MARWIAEGETEGYPRQRHYPASVLRTATTQFALEKNGEELTNHGNVGAGPRQRDMRAERILDDETAPVRFGSMHFVARAESRSESPAILWKTLVTRHFKGCVKPPFNDSARLSAGLPRSFDAGVAS